MAAGPTDVWRDPDGQASRPDDDPAVAEILGVPTMTLATAEAAGGPHAAPVFFAADAALQLVLL
ncbi:MAG: hypothetical protein IVW53_15245 [Chloroflexi bacterium]|nr:hypothetical protein [Chloroflexota bacterium]